MCDGDNIAFNCLQLLLPVLGSGEQVFQAPGFFHGNLGSSQAGTVIVWTWVPPFFQDLHQCLFHNSSSQFRVLFVDHLNCNPAHRAEGVF